MGKWESWDVKLLWMYVSEWICLCVYLRWLRVGRVVQGGVGGPAVCERDGNWGKCVKGPYPSVLHIFAEAAVGAWLTDEWGVRGWHTGGHAPYYYISTAMLSAQLLSDGTTSKPRKLNPAEWAQNCTMGHGRNKNNSQEGLSPDVHLNFLTDLYLN